MDVRNMRYIKIKNKENISTIEIDDFNDFLKLIEEYRPKIIFVKIGNNKLDSGYFMFWSGNVAFKIKNNNYKNIFDMENGISEGFPDGNKYYDAIKKGFSNYEEYSKAIAVGYNNKIEYDDSQKLGFRGSLEEIKKVLGTINPHLYINKFGTLISSFKYEADVYRYAKENGFENFVEFKDALSKSFINSEEYREAIKNGFKDYYQYKEAKEKGFINAKDFEEAKKLDIHSYAEYNLYKTLLRVKIGYRLQTMEEALLFKILLELKPKTKISVEKIWKELTNEENSYLPIGFAGEIRAKWFSRKFNNLEDLEKYLSRSRKIKNNIGFYDANGGVFERFFPKFKKVIVDGSNVAWNEGSKDQGDKAHAKNIKLVVKSLKEKGYSDIEVIVDASLRHQVDDLDIFAELAIKGILKEAPANRSADEFIIKYAKDKNAYIVSNDTFKDWKEKDKWIKENIDKYRVAFMIDEENEIVKFDEKIDKFND